jgi:tellurium resistance protein TerD
MVDLDSSCVAVNREGNVDMNESVYYGNLVNSNLSLVHSGDEQTGEAGGDDERIQVELDRIPSHIIALYFILTLATPPNKTFADVKSAKMRFISTETKVGICRFVPSEMGNNTALFLVRIAREGTHWNLTPIAEGDECARDFGSLIPELKGYSRDLVPGIVIDPQERIAIMRKGGTIRVTDYLPGHKLPPWVTFGLAWDVTNGVNIDLDASAIMLNESLATVEMSGRVMKSVTMKRLTLPWQVWILKSNTLVLSSIHFPVRSWMILPRRLVISLILKLIQKLQSTPLPILTSSTSTLPWSWDVFTAQPEMNGICESFPSQPKDWLLRRWWMSCRPSFYVTLHKLSVFHLIPKLS